MREPGGGIAQWTGVCADIHEQKMLAETLARRTELLIASNKEFQKFAYRVSHDLKEPLRMIGAFTEILIKRNQDHLDTESQTFTKYILDGVRRVESHMRDLLEYARAGSLEIRTDQPIWTPSWIRRPTIFVLQSAKPAPPLLTTGCRA